MNLPNVPVKNWENKILLKWFCSRYKVNQIQQRLFPAQPSGVSRQKTSVKISVYSVVPQKTHFPL